MKGKEFLLKQVEEIKEFVSKNSIGDVEFLVHFWIEKYAKKFRDDHEEEESEP